MLHWIRIENIAVIEALELDFNRGLNLLTGETGAGKSILIDSLGLLLGARASSDRLRTGAEQGFVEAGFQLETASPGFVDLLTQASIPFDPTEREIVVRRELTASGRSKVIVNGRASVASLLRELAPFLADVHGQGENLSLLNPDLALELLDHYGKLDRDEVATTFEAFTVAERKYAELAGRLRRRSEQEQQLRFELAELDELAPEAGEDEELERERELLAHSEGRREIARRCYASLYEQDGAVLSVLASVFRDLDSLAELDPSLTEPLRSREDIRSQTEDLALLLRDYEGSIETSPERLASVEARLALLERAKKRYGSGLSELVHRQTEIRSQLDELDSGDEQLDSAAKTRDTAAGHYWSAAAALSKKRVAAAKRLEKAVMKELPSLAMEKATFRMRCEPTGTKTERADWERSGVDRVRFLFSANPGEELRSLDQVASGGELSRFMLALKVVSARGEAAKTLVFDEIDTGISGRVSHAVGEKLEEVATHHQVICVTHQPQIASFAGSHYKVDKLESKGRTLTRVEHLNDSARIDEIARMLAGATITESAREHATRLVAGESDD